MDLLCNILQDSSNHEANVENIEVESDEEKAQNTAENNLSMRRECETLPVEGRYTQCQ